MKNENIKTMKKVLYGFIKFYFIRFSIILMGMLKLVDRSCLGRDEIISCKFKSYYPYYYIYFSITSNTIVLYNYKYVVD
jgi:hypothetical protein